MARPALKWIVSALPVAAMAPVTVAFGLNLIPARDVVAAAGKSVPWAIAWALVWIVAASALALAGVMATTGKT